MRTYVCFFHYTAAPGKRKEGKKTGFENSGDNPSARRNKVQAGEIAGA